MDTPTLMLLGHPKTGGSVFGCPSSFCCLFVCSRANLSHPGNDFPTVLQKGKLHPHPRGLTRR